MMALLVCCALGLANPPPSSTLLAATPRVPLPVGIHGGIRAKEELATPRTSHQSAPPTPPSHARRVQPWGFLAENLGLKKAEEAEAKH